MCGRYSLGVTPEELAAAFDLDEIPSFHEPRYNIAPTQDAPILIRGPEGLRVGPVRWGLVPHWAESPTVGNRHVNARSETVDRRPAFRDAFRSRRCLVPADGFYEWQAGPSPKQPVWIHREDGGLLTFAGLWERWRWPDGGPLVTFTVLTTDAAPWIHFVHDRMPVMLEAEQRERWLDPDADARELKGLLRPRAEAMVLQPVSPVVNRATNEGPECVEPVGPPIARPEPEPRLDL